MESKKEKQKIAYIALAILAVFALAFVWLGASGTLTNWRAQYIAEKEYEELLASASDVTDEMTLRALLLMEEELEITVTEDIEIKTAFIVNGTKTLRGEAVLSSNLGILNPISILNVTTDAKLTIDGLVLDGNANAVGVKVENGGELTYLSGDIKFAGTYGIVTNGLVTIEDIKITESTTGALNVGYDGKAYFKGGQIVDNRHIGIYVEAQGYLEISGDATLQGTSGQGIRNRGELVVNGGIFKDIGRFVISNHNKLVIESKDHNRITMKDIDQGIVYNQEKGEAIIKDVHGINLGQDAFKSVGGTMTVENCIVDTVKTHGFYVSYSEVTIKDTIINKPGSCGVYAITPAVVTLENVELNDTGSRGIMAKGATITGTNVTVTNPKNYGVSNQSDSNKVYGVNEYTNLSITGAQNNSVYLGGEAKMVINDSTLGESARTNVYVNNGELTLNNVEILGSAADNCAAISINKWGICNLIGNSKIHGKGIRGVNISGVFNMQGGEIYGYDVKKFSGGAVRLYKDGTFNMSGGKIYNNKTELAGGAVYMASNTIFNMTGGTITNNTATTTGGAVHMATATKFNMKGGTISNNKTLKASGGAVYTYSKMTMSGGTIANNQSNTVGGAINLNSGTNSDTKHKEYGSLTMTGGTIQKNHSNGNGGGLHISGGTTVVMSGGRIVDNTSEKQGSGINHNGNFTMSGSAYVGGNVVTLGGTSKTVTILGENLTAHSAENPLLIEPAYATEKGTAVAVCESDVFSGNVIAKVAPGNKAYASFAKQNEKIVIGSYNETVDMDMTGAETVYVSDFQKLKDEVESTKTKKNVVICADIKMEGVITIPTSTTVAIRDDGVKRTLTRESGNTTSFFRTSFGTGLYLTGTKDGNLVLDGKTTGEVDQTKVQQLVVVRGATEIENVTFKDNETTKLMGAFVRHLYGSLNVENSSFSAALATAGGAISAANGTETITNCTFTDNETTGGGAAIRVDKNATVTVVDSEFTSNNAGSVGGAINTDGGVLKVTNSDFTANTSKGTSGAINLTNKATAEIKASTFDGNKSIADDAGAIKVNKSALVLDGTTFKNNTTTKNGGAIFLEGKINDTTYANVTATDCTFESNTAGGTGGAIKGETGIVITLTDSVLAKNTATGSTGGAIDLYRSTVNATGCTFTENTAKASGGAIYLNKEGVANVKTSTFTSNTSATAGGAIYVFETATAKVEDSTFNTNSTGNNGGAMFVNYGSVADVKDSTFTGNFTTKWQGGAIANQNGQLTLAGTTFEGNYSEVSNGGAIYINENTNYTYESVTTLEAGNSFIGNYTKAKDTDGGAIYIAGASELTVKTGNTFEENIATRHGGAIYVANGAVELAGMFVENTAKSNGGAVYTAGGEATVTADFDTNKAVSGGAIYHLAGKLEITAGLYKANEASNDGGALYLGKNTKETLVSGAEFTGNKAERANNGQNRGSAIYVQGGNNAATDWTLKNSNVHGNVFSYVSKDYPGCDILIADGTTTTLGSNTSVGVIQQKWGNANPDTTDPYAVIKVSEEYKGTEPIVIIPVTFDHYKDNALIQFADDMSDEAKAATAAKIEIHNYATNPPSKEYFVQTDGTIASNTAKIGEVYYKSLKDAVAGAKTGDVIEVIANETIAETITVDRNKAITITNATGKNATISRGSELNAAPLFTVNSGSTLTLGSSSTTNTFTVDGKKVASTSTLILVNSGATFNLAENATIKEAYAKTTTGDGNKTSKNCGGALYNNGGTVNLVGNFTGNKAFNGGAVYNYQGTLNIIGGVYSGNVASGQGGAVYVGSGTTDSASIKNAEMTDNDVTGATNRGSAIYVQGSANITEVILQDCNIHDNSLNGKDENDPGCDILAADGTKLILYNNTDLGVITQLWNTNGVAQFVMMEEYTGKIVITPQKTVKVSDLLVDLSAITDATEKQNTVANVEIRNYKGCYPNYTKEYYLLTDGTMAAKTAKIDETYYSTLSEAVSAAENDDVIEVVADENITSTITLPASKSVTIKNVTGRTVTLTRGGSLTGKMFDIPSGSTLTLGDAEDNAGELIVDGNKDITATGELIKNAGTFVMAQNTTIQNAKRGASGNGGALYNSGTATLSGNFVGNTAYRGGAVYSSNASVLTVDGGLYQLNVADNRGGAIYLDSVKSNVNISNVEMTQNDVTNAASRGAAIYIGGSSPIAEVTLTNCNIHGNTTDGNSADEPGCDILTADGTKLIIYDNINLGIITQLWTGKGLAQYVMMQEYTGEIIITPQKDVKVEDLLVDLSVITDATEKQNTAAKIVVRKYSSASDYTTYGVGTDGKIKSVE